MTNLQPARRAAFWGALALCLAAAALRCADLLLWTDPATGFVLWGSVWLRCLAPAGAVLLIRWAASFTAPHPTAWYKPDHALTALLLAAGVLAVLSAAGSVPQRLPAWAAGAGFALLAWYNERRRGSALAGVLPLPWLLWTAVHQVLVAPASLHRVGAALRVMGLVAALAFFAALLRLLYVPGRPAVKTLFTAGFACFLLCTCLGLPQAVCESVWGLARPGALWEAAALACLGLAGLLCAWGAAGPNLIVATLPRD